jgi:single-stranded DNA-binding protein
MNEIKLSGNVVTASKLITTTSGVKLTKFRMANNRCVKRGSNGSDDKIETVYIGCTYWNRHIDLSVGDRVLVSGILKQDEPRQDGDENNEEASDTLPRSTYHISVEELYNLEKRPKQEMSKYTISEDKNA